MTDSFTTNLNLTKPEVGASPDTWGTKVNADMDTVDAVLGGVIYGLTLSTTGSSSTFGIAAGAASGMSLGSAYTKTTGSWAVGSGNGSLDTGTIANSTWYHVWLIQRSDTGVADVLISTSASSPTMPNNYDRKRRIGAMNIDSSGNWLKFVQKGDMFLWATARGVISTFSLGTSAILINASTPPGVQVVVMINGIVSNASSNVAVLLTSPDQTDVAPGAVAGNYTAYVGAAGTNCWFGGHYRTDTSSQIRARSDTASTTLICASQGYIDPRGQY